MCAVRCISNSLCGEWKLKRVLQDTEAPAWSLVFFSYSKNNLKYALSFGTVKGLLLCVCIHNINIVLLQNRKTENAFSAGLEQERFNDEPKQLEAGSQIW